MKPRTPTYNSWLGMRERCSNPNHNRYRYYGGRGIRVCDRWQSFAAFLADMGEKPAGTSIDRVDLDGDYEPGNCHWATATEQARNKSNAKLEPHEPAQIRWLHSLGYAQVEIAKFFGVSQSLVSAITTNHLWAEA